jgi:hypothetical protein
MKEVNATSERWRYIPEFPDYAISNIGRIIRITKAQGTYPSYVYKLTLDKKGYQTICLTKNGKEYGKKVHQLVALAFLGPCPDKHEINHKDGVKANNQLNNLEYVTSSENQRHALRMGLKRKLRGSQSGHVKLTEAKVLEILGLWRLGWPIANIARAFKVAERTIDHIVRGDSWNWLTGINKHKI